MYVSQKSQYTLRALFEFAKRRNLGPATAAEVAEAQAIPPRFLELILQGLRGTGHIESRRGVKGGYVLAAAPETVTVGSIIPVCRWFPGTREVRRRERREHCPRNVDAAPSSVCGPASRKPSNRSTTPRPCRT